MWRQKWWKGVGRMWANPQPDVAEMVEMVEDYTQGIPTEVCAQVEFPSAQLLEFGRLIQESTKAKVA